MAIPLGSEVKDRMTGLTGIAQSYHYDIEGTVQVGVQPKVSDGKTNKHPEAFAIDEVQLEVTGTGLSAIAVDPQPNTITLGEMYEDQVTGYRGIAVRRSEWLNGCSHVTLQAKAKKDGTTPESHRCHVSTVKRVGAGIAKMLKAKPKTKAAPRTGGGPSAPVSSL